MHNKVNKKLNIPNSKIPSFKEVCQRYEEYRAQCNIDKSGCVHGLKDYTSKKCELNIVPLKKENIYNDSKKIELILSMNDREIEDIKYKLFDISLIKNREITDKIRNNIGKILEKILDTHGYELKTGQITKNTKRKQIKIGKDTKKVLEKTKYIS